MFGQQLHPWAIQVIGVPIAAVRQHTGRGSGELFIWDVQRGERIYAIAGHPGMVYAVAWGASKNLVIIGGGDGLLRWWDVQSGECVRVQEAHQGTVQSLRRSPDGAKVASCGDDGTIVLWDVHSGDYLQTLRRDRPYERLDITGIKGLTEAQKASLIALGAVEKLGDDAPARPAGAAHVTDERQPMSGDRNVVIGLPFQPTPFIGRAAEVAEIARLLGDSACRVLTLLGPGGIGKTRLALVVAASQTAVFADGVAFVTLAAVGTSDQIVAAIGETLGLTFAGQPDSTAYLFDYLRARRMLLVLDDFDHLLDGIDLVTAILAHAPQVTILVTSRARLKLQAEWLFDVQGLAYPPEDPYGPAARQSLADLNQYSAVQPSDLTGSSDQQFRSGVDRMPALRPPLARSQICCQDVIHRAIVLTSGSRCSSIPHYADRVTRIQLVFAAILPTLDHKHKQNGS
jgi:hypothetical protein